MEVIYKFKKIEIPNIISCSKDGGRMIFNPIKRCYECINVEGCTNKVSLREYIKKEKLIEKTFTDKEREFI